MEAYLDNSATTPPCKEAIAAVTAALTVSWGNPSSLHTKGIEAEAVLENARSELAKKLNCGKDEVFFTSGGTESNNIAIFGTVNALKRQGSRIVTTGVEHSSIHETMKHLETEGYEVIYLKVDNTGRISESELMQAVNAKTILVSIMAVNNEVGTIQPVETARRAVLSARAPAFVHCDAVQAFGKMNIRPAAMGVDLLTVSSHKVNGPKGAGALYVKKGVRLVPRIFGGSQEGSVRSGTEPMPAIAGFGAAVKALVNTNAELEKIRVLRDYMVEELGFFNDIVVNSPPDALPFVTNISVLGIKSEPMLNFLSERGVYVSSGSACSKGQRSRALEAMGLDEARLDSPLRISFSRFTTRDDIEMLLDGIAEGQKKIRRS